MVGQVEKLEAGAAAGHHVAGGNHGHGISVGAVAKAIEVEGGGVIGEVVVGQRQVLAAAIELDAGDAVGGNDVLDGQTRAQVAVGVDADAGPGRPGIAKV